MAEEKIKVLVVDDSLVIRQIICETLKYDDTIEVVGTAEDPFEARALIKKLNPDIITLDVEMPKMDGIAFLKNLMRLRPMPVIMISTLTTKGADVTLEALEIGAIDFIAKPSVDVLVDNQESFKDVLIAKIKSAVIVEQRNFVISQSRSASSNQNVLSFPGCKHANHLIAIGASTGGTEAIKTILTRLPSNSPAIVITQHIPKSFSARFAKRMDMCCQVTVEEATHGQKIKVGHVYIAPGGKHLTVSEKGGALFCQLNNEALVNRHRPAVDVLFSSLTPFADNVQAILLTGMGKDGADGMLKLKQLGANTIIQDQQSSLIWGMPGSAYKINAQVSQCSINDMASNILKFAADKVQSPLVALNSK
ncbi:protein-glutamate methylesterase/protein-glutamine glutaminase [Thalassotalea sp. PLHSN55]|uniref:protein-glutamate methylesterase/protein-glutamine glutaminase n=1 Tax=Thalassotalea sp. PLHSN55 TaxID=3435888 RepID=UPI003F867EA5